MIAAFGFSVVLTSLNHMVNKKNFTSMSKPLATHQSFEIFGSVLFFARWLVLPVYLTWMSGGSIMATLCNIAPMYMVGGYYLALFFLISHNFDGVHMFDRDKSPTTVSATSNNRFLYRQVITASNVGGPFLCFLNGGLNYQIEHHLFPRIQHSHYPTIAPIVRAYCKAHNIPYVHYPTVWENVYACSKHLFALGNHQESKSMVEK